MPCFLVAAGLCRRAGRGQAGAPAAPRRQARARTNELDAAKRRPTIGSEEPEPFCWVVLGWRGRLARSFPRLWLWVAGVASHAPIRLLPQAGGRHDRASGGRAAQSGHRARRGRLMRICELARGSRPSPLAWLTSGTGVGEQVAGAGEQLAGDRGGGDLGAAAPGDALVAGGELGRAWCTERGRLTCRC